MTYKLLFEILRLDKHVHYFVKERIAICRKKLGNGGLFPHHVDR